MKHATEMIADDNGFEMVVDYKFEKSNDVDNGPLVYTELNFVEVVFAGRGINILPIIHPAQKEFIFSKLNYL